MVIELYHHPQSPPSAAVRCVVRELGIDFKEHFIDFFAEEHKGEKYADINPHKEVPAIRDGDVVLTQSRAIAMYLCRKYEATDKKEKLYPTDPIEVAKFNALLFRDNDNYEKMLKYANVEAIFEEKACGPNEDLVSKAEDILFEYEALVSKHDYMFGDHLTILDFFSALIMHEFTMTDYSEWDKFPNLKIWKGKLAERPYFHDILEAPTEKSKEMYKAYCEKAKVAMDEAK